MEARESQIYIFCTLTFTFCRFIWQLSTDLYDKGPVALLKANMIIYILLQMALMAAIFFLSSLYLKQGIDSVYVMVGFICKG